MTNRLPVVPYVLLRLPAALVDRSLIRRLPVNCRRRTVFDHGLGTADHWAGLILDDESISGSGRLRIEHAGRFSGSTSAVTAHRSLPPVKAHASVRAALCSAHAELAP